jgi:hypothetical protein
MVNKLDSALPPPFKAAALPIVVNHTPWPSQYFQHVDPSGEVFHVMVSRLSYSLRNMTFNAPELPVPQLLEPLAQIALIDEDQYTGAANASSVIAESDFAPFKPKCDVLLVNATAYAPNAKPSERWTVGLRFGEAIDKKLQITGARQYQRAITRLGALQLSEPEPTTQVSIDYQLAYGGPNCVLAHMQASDDDQAGQGDQAGSSDSSSLKPAQTQASTKPNALPDYFERNPIGTGRMGERKERDWIEHESQRVAKAKPQQEEHQQKHQQLAPQPASSSFTNQGAYKGPQIEAFGKPFTGQADYPVVGFGPIGRWWLPRRSLAGTHDAAWQERQWPKSPKDHDYRYWNCAPDDQQIAYPAGGEVIALTHLTPSRTAKDSTVRFKLPQQDLRLLVRLTRGPMVFVPMVIDTVSIDFAAATLTLVRRALVAADNDVRKLELGTWGEDEDLPYENSAVPAKSPFTR